MMNSHGRDGCWCRLLFIVELNAVPSRRRNCGPMPLLRVGRCCSLMALRPLQRVSECNEEKCQVANHTATDARTTTDYIMTFCGLLCSRGRCARLVANEPHRRESNEI